MYEVTVWDCWGQYVKTQSFAYRIDADRYVEALPEYYSAIVERVSE